jgi:WD40 repeat protein
MAPCGWLLVSDDDGAVHVKDMKNSLSTVKVLRIFPTRTKIISMCVSDEKGLVGLMSASEIKVMDFVTEKIIFAFNSGGQGDFHTMRNVFDCVYIKHFIGFSPSGEKLICSMDYSGSLHDEDGVVIMFDLATGGEVYKLVVPGAFQGFNTIELSKDEKYLLTAGFDMWVTIWDVENKEVLVVFGDSEDPTPDKEYWDVKELVLNGSATFLDDSTISCFTCWKNQSEEVLLVINFLTGEVKHKHNLQCDTYNVVQAANQIFPVAYVDDFEASIDVQTTPEDGVTLRCYLHNAQNVDGVFEAMNDEHCCICEGGEVFDTCPATAHSEKMIDIKFTPNNKFLVTCAEDNLIKLWNIEHNRLESSILLEAVPSNICFISKHMQQEKMALCMSMHDRLGQQSHVQILGDNVLGMVFELVCKGGVVCDCE